MPQSQLEDVELRSQSVVAGTALVNEAAEPQDPPLEQGLAPTDGGKAAWKLLITAFVFEALLWGFPLSFGVFQEYYSRLPEFRGNAYISVVGTVATGLSYLGAPLTIPLIKKFQGYQREMIWIGWPLCLIGLVAGSFASSLEVLILSQGVLYGLGFLIFYYPILSMVNEYWIQRRGMAYGLLCSATGLSGTVLPLLSEFLLQRYGHRTTLRIIAVALTILTGPLIPFLQPRLPPSQHRADPATDWSFLRSPLFYIYSFSNLFQGLAYFLPSLYLPSTATLLGSSPSRAALLLTVMSLSQTIGQFLFGWLSDYTSRPGSGSKGNGRLSLLLTSSTVIAAVCSLTLWGLASSLTLLFVFAAIYGLFATAFTAMWARMASQVSDHPGTMPMVFALFNAGKGVGNVVAGPVSAALLRTPLVEGYKGSAVSRYGGVVTFTGTMMLLSAFVVGGWSVGPIAITAWRKNAPRLWSYAPRILPC